MLRVCRQVASISYLLALNHALEVTISRLLLVGLLVQCFRLSMCAFRPYNKTLLVRVNDAIIGMWEKWCI